MSAITFTVNIDGRTVAWSSLDSQADADDEAAVAGGVLAGDKTLVSAVKSLLEETAISESQIAHPSIYYQFSNERNTPADVTAAMIYIGAGRAILSDEGWDVLNAAIGLTDDEDEEFDGEVVY